MVTASECRVNNVNDTFIEPIQIDKEIKLILLCSHNLRTLLRSAQNVVLINKFSCLIMHHFSSARIAWLTERVMREVEGNGFRRSWWWCRYWTAVAVVVSEMGGGGIIPCGGGAVTAETGGITATGGGGGPPPLGGACDPALCGASSGVVLWACCNPPE